MAGNIVSKKKIAVFGLKGIPAIGGTASVGENIVKALSDEFDFTIYATSSHASNKRFINNIRQFIVKKFLPHKLNIFYYNLISAIHAVVLGNYDLVHTHQIDTAFILPILRVRYKVISTHHGRTYMMSKWGGGMKLFFRFNEWLMMKLAHQVTFVAKSEQEVAENTYGGKYVTIPNGINLNEQIDSECEYSNYILFAAGRIVPHKGCHVFLEALKQMQYTGKVLVVGDYNHMPAYKEELFSYKENLNVEFVGMIKDKKQLLRIVQDADLFVYPSFYEAMSIMLLEAVLVKVPIICSDIEQHVSVFDMNEVTFFKSGDISDLKTKINFFFIAPEAFKRKVELASVRLLKDYDWKVIINKYEKIYNALIIA